MSDTDQSLATSDNVQFAQVTTTGNAIIGGNLTVNGTTTTVNSSNMTVDDQLIELGNGRSGSASGDAGIVIERGSDANAFIGFDESADKFTVGTGTFTGASTGDLTITTGTLVANIEGNVTGAVTGNADTATALATARTIAGQSFDGTANISIAPTDLTGVNATATELNIMDGDTSATSTTLADADRVVVNDAGTMKQVALTDFETYFETSLDTLSNVTTVGALNSGSITSGFGAIDNGSSAITTTGTVTFGTLSDGTDSITDIVTSVSGSSTNAQLPSAAAVESRIQAVNATSNNVTGLTATGAELNTVADFSAVSVDTSTAIANNDALLVFDNGNNIGYRDVDLLDTYFSATTKTLTNKTLTSPIVTGMHFNDSGFTVEGSAADGNDTTVAFTNPTANRTITFPDATGNVPVFTAAPAAAIADGTSGQFLTTNGSGVLSFANAGGGFDADFVIADKTATYTVVAGDAGKVLTHSANDITFNLTAAATLGAGFHVWIKNEGASGDITSIDPNGSETLDGRAIEKLFTGESIHIYTDGSNWYSLDRTIMWVGNTATDYYARPLAAGGGAIAGGLQSSASGVTSVAVGYTATATANGSAAIGANANSTANRGVALGWSKAGGTDSLAAAITSGSASYGASGANSIAIGYLAKSTNSQSVAISGSTNVASGIQAASIGGENNTASGTRATALGGSTNYATGQESYAFGNRASAKEIGKYSYGGYFGFSGTFSGGFGVGGSQGGMMVLGAATTDAHTYCFAYKYKCRRFY